MTNTISLTRTLRVENETGLSGSEAQEVEAFDDLDLELAAGAESDIGLGAITA